MRGFALMALLLAALRTFGEPTLSPLFVTGTLVTHRFVTTASGYGAISPDRRHVAAYFSKADTRNIRMGQSARIRLMPNQSSSLEAKGRVASLMRDVDPKTGQSIVTIALPPQALPPRSYAFVRIEISAREAFALPTTAVIAREGAFFVYKRKGENDFDKTPVEIGNHEPDFTEIKSGLKPGDIVLIRGALEWARQGVQDEDDE